MSNADIPLVRVESEPTPQIPSRTEDPQPAPSTSSFRTTSDKLSALPFERQGIAGPSRGRSPSRLHRIALSEHQPQAQHSAPALAHLPPNTSTSSSHDARPRSSHESAPASLGSRASLQNVRAALHRVTSPRSRTPSPQRSSPNRVHSPLRLLWPLNRVHSREEPFVPVDPYRFHLPRFSLSHANVHVTAAPGPNPAEKLDAQLQRLRARLRAQARQLTLQAYRHLLLRMPSLYFSRVSRLFEEAEVSRPEIERMIEGCASGLHFPRGEWAPPEVSPALSRFKVSWEEFVDSAIREWKTLNVVSALLLSALLTIFQVEDAANEPTTRTAALISLVAALWSLIYGGVYIMRFGTMRSMYKASSWAQEAQKTETSIWWNVWVLLALPAVWLAWSLVAFIVSILSFVWTTGATATPPTLPHSPTSPGALVPRVLVTSICALGFVYFILVVRTFAGYGSSMRAPLGRGPDYRVGAETASTNAGARGAGDGRVTQSLAGVASGLYTDSAMGVDALGGGTSPVDGPDGMQHDLEKGSLAMEYARTVSPRL